MTFGRVIIHLVICDLTFNFIVAGFMFITDMGGLIDMSSSGMWFIFMFINLSGKQKMPGEMKITPAWCFFFDHGGVVFVAKWQTGM